MSQRETNLLWLRDTLDQLVVARQQLEWITDREAVRVLTESMLRDLEHCQRLCETLHQKTLPRSVVS